MLGCVGEGSRLRWGQGDANVAALFLCSLFPFLLFARCSIIAANYYYPPPFFLNNIFSNKHGKKLEVT